MSHRHLVYYETIKQNKMLYYTLATSDFHFIEGMEMDMKQGFTISDFLR